MAAFPNEQRGLPIVRARDSLIPSDVRFLPLLHSITHNKMLESHNRQVQTLASATLSLRTVIASLESPESTERPSQGDLRDLIGVKSQRSEPPRALLPFSGSKDLLAYRS